MEQQIPGLTYESDAISEDMETQLIDFLKTIEYDSVLYRKTKSYGYRYVYARASRDVNRENVNRENVNRENNIEQIPEILSTLNEGHNQCIINVYEPGEGIGAHIDDTRQFGDTVIIYSLGSDIEMEFSPKFRTDKVVRIILKRRSKITLTDDARYNWTHCIKKRKSDNGIKRGIRYSVTFRSVKLRNSNDD